MNGSPVHRFGLQPQSISSGIGFWSLLMVTLLCLGSEAFAREEPTLDRLKTLYEDRDYFTLFEALQSSAKEPDSLILFYRAATLGAFNRTLESNRVLDQIEHDASLEASVRQQMHLTRFRNSLRRHEYTAARKAGALALREGRGKQGVEFLPGVRNSLKLLAMLDEVPPQEITIPRTTRLTPIEGRLLGRVNDEVRPFHVDGRAPFSILSRSVAEAFGLKIFEVGLDVGTTSNRSIKADLAVAKQFNLSAIEYRHVIFLVLPDGMQAMDGQLNFDGILGFPIVEALGEIRMEQDGTWEVPVNPPRRIPRTLAFDDVDLITPIRFGNERCLARLDSGARLTTGYHSFHERFEERLEAQGARFDKALGPDPEGPTGPALRLPTFSFELGGHEVNLKYVDVFTEPVPRLGNNLQLLTIGQDTLNQFDRVILNFRDMAIVVE
jgi:hypothetical protein